MNFRKVLTLEKSCNKLRVQEQGSIGIVLTSKH